MNILSVFKCGGGYVWMLYTKDGAFRMPKRDAPYKTIGAAKTGFRKFANKHNFFNFEYADQIKGTELNVYQMSLWDSV